jgi:hypothetical protein
MMRQRIFVLFTGLPVLMRLGLLVLVLGAGLDLLYHAAPPGWTMWLDVTLGAHAVGAHLITLLGMVLTLLGIVVRRRRPQATSEEAALSGGGLPIDR